MFVYSTTDAKTLASAFFLDARTWLSRPICLEKAEICKANQDNILTYANFFFSKKVSTIVETKLI